MLMFFLLKICLIVLLSVLNNEYCGSKPVVARSQILTSEEWTQGRGAVEDFPKHFFKLHKNTPIIK